jgi:preprotein translocase subunit SecB
VDKLGKKYFMKKILLLLVTLVSLFANSQTCQDLDNWKTGNNTTPKLYSIGAGGFITDGYLTGVNKYYFQGLYEKYTASDSKPRSITNVKYWFGALVPGHANNMMNFIGYKPDPITKLPKDTLFIVSKTVQEVANNLNQQGYYTLDLSATKIKYTGDFYVGLTMRYRNAWGGTSTTTPQDTIALISNDPGSTTGTLNTAYYGSNTQNGFVFDTLVTGASKMSLGIFVNVCELSSAKDITSFSFANPAVTGTINANNIALTVPSGTNVTNLIATFANSALSTVTVGAIAQVSGTTPNNFTSPLTYTVTAEDGTTKTYTVNVTIAAPLSSACDITAFSFSNPAVTGIINANNIALTVPSGTNVTNLIATFTSSAKSNVKIGGTAQVSGTTPNNFTSPLTYTVTAEDGTTKTYTVNVTIAAPLSSACDITAFSFSNPAVTGTINSNNIALTVPSGTNVTNLIATFTSSAKSNVKIGGTAQVSGTTPNNFTSPLTYTVTAEDGTTKTYTVNVTIAAPLSSACDITAFSFSNPAVTGIINANNIALTVPSGTNVTNLIATFTSSAKSNVKIGGTAQVSGTTPNNFTSPLTYTITAEDGTTKTYIVTVTIDTPVSQTCQDLDNWKTGNNTTPKLYSIGAGGFITDGYLTGVNKYYFQGLYEKYTASDSKPRSITNVKYWFGALVPGHANNMMNFIGYKPDPITKLPKDTLFIVSKTVQEVANNLNQQGYYTLDLSATKIKYTGDFYVGLTMRYRNAWGGTSTTTPQDTIALISNDPGSTTGTLNTAYYGSNTQNGFVFDTLVTGASKMSLGIFVNVCELSSAKDITSFSFANPAVTGTINANNIALTVPSGTNVTNLIATFANSALSTVTVGAIAQVSGTTPNNFTSPLTYTVTAEDGTTKTYTVNVTIAAPLSSACDITAFSFSNPAVTGIINANNIALTVPSGTNVTNLIATFTSSAKSNVKIGGTAQVSGTTPNNFTSPLTYTITAEDGTTKTYIVTVTIDTPVSQTCQDLDNWKTGNNTTPKLYSIGAGGFITDGYLTGVNKYYFQGLYEKYTASDSKPRSITNVKYWVWCFSTRTC